MATVAGALALTLVGSTVAFAQSPTPADQINAAQTALGFEASALLTAAIAEYGPIVLIGIGFLVAMGLVWTVLRYFRRGAR